LGIEIEWEIELDEKVNFIFARIEFITMLITFTTTSSMLSFPPRKKIKGEKKRRLQLDIIKHDCHPIIIQSPTMLYEINKGHCKFKS
jgi:hypothetical protein